MRRGKSYVPSRACGLASKWEQRLVGVRGWWVMGEVRGQGVVRP
jgi:hypothetical protein